MVSHCHLHLQSPSDLWYWELFPWLGICILYSEKCLFKFFAKFCIWTVCLSVVESLFTLLILSFAAYFLILMKSDLFIFPFVSLTFSVIRIHCQIKSHENLPYIFHCEFYAFSSSIWNINSFWVNFGMWCEIGVQFSFFCM